VGEAPFAVARYTPENITKYRCIAGDNALLAISLLLDELKTEDTEARIAAMRKLRVVAAALGPERTKRELIPFLNGRHWAGFSGTAMLGWKVGRV
jgi:serine/threonine-protein phosphatase 2A regulatory subunit A